MVFSSCRADGAQPQKDLVGQEMCFEKYCEFYYLLATNEENSEMEKCELIVNSSQNSSCSNLDHLKVSQRIAWTF